MPKKPLLFRKSASAGQKGGGKGNNKGGKGNAKGNPKRGKGGGKGGGGGGGGKAGDRGNTPNVLCNCCGAQGHVKADCRQKDKECHTCGKVGHISTVCRAGTAPKGGGKGAPLPLAAFEAEAKRRGMLVLPAPEEAEPEEPPAVEHTVAQIQVKSKAKDDASKKLDKLIDRKLLAEKALQKLREEVGEAAVALDEAEDAFKKELAATHFVHAPKVDAAAINLSAFLKNLQDPSKLIVDFGNEFNCDDLAAVDKAHVEGKMDTLLQNISKHILSNFAPLKLLMDEARTAMADAKEGAQKKRKGADGSAVDAEAASGASASSAPAAPVTSPASPSAAEKEATAADKKAADAAATAEAARIEADEAKATALEKEKEAQTAKLAREAERTVQLKIVSDNKEKAAALQSKLAKAPDADVNQAAVHAQALKSNLPADAEMHKDDL